MKRAIASRRPHFLASVMIAVTSLTLTPVDLRSGDWPQILGPNRNGTAADEPPIPVWPKAGPPLLWSVPIGSGFAGPAVVGNRVVVFHRIEKIERVECFEAGGGKRLWRADFPASYPGGVNPDNGPRCVPLVHGPRVYVFGAAGNLHCLQLVDGSKVWSRDAYADYDGQEGYFGAGSTPIVADSALIVNVGGRNAGLVAFGLANGKTLWQATDDRASYSSPTIAQLNGASHAIFVTRSRCLAVEPKNGKIAFAFAFGRPGPTVNAATPLVFDSHLFVSASYEVGARLAKLGTPPVDVWANDETMSSQYSTCVFREGHLYGIHGREDYANGELRCFEALTGKVKWNVPKFGTGHLTLVGDQLLILTTDGQLVLAAGIPEKYRELARFAIAGNITRGLPALSRGRFFFRDNAENAGRLFCWQLAAAPPK